VEMVGRQHPRPKTMHAGQAGACLLTFSWRLVTLLLSLHGVLLHQEHGRRVGELGQEGAGVWGAAG
jgi:hypothetical protein